MNQTTHPLRTITSHKGRAENPSSKRARVVVLDDEKNILRALARSLGRHFDIIPTSDPDEALEAVQHPDTAVFVSDQRMPRASGSEVLAKALLLRPDVQRVLLTGYSDPNSLADAINKAGIHRFVSKPWNDEDLRNVLSECVRNRSQTEEKDHLQVMAEEQITRMAANNEALAAEIRKRTELMVEASLARRDTVEQFTALMRTVVYSSDPAQGEHARRVAALARVMARRLDLDEAETSCVYVAALFHDVGKFVNAGIGVEGGEQQHPERGANLLAAVAALKDSADFIRHHHEAFDGSGYPDGLAGYAIPLGARIVAAASAFDHALNDTPNGERADAKGAIRLISTESGSLLDPEMVRLLASIAGGESAGMVA